MENDKILSAFFVETFPVGLFQCNCSLLMRPSTREALVIDPGDESEKIIERIEAENLKVLGLWHTHAHLDHIGATLPLLEYLSVRALQEGWAEPVVYLHEGDRWLYENVKIQASLLGLRPFEVPSFFESLKDNQPVNGFSESRVLHTPGHTPGSCCLLVRGEFQIQSSYGDGDFYQNHKKLLFSGDTLFRRSIGRTDLWGGDVGLIQKSIQSKIYSLSDETSVIPGHGPLTSLEEEKRKNPFVRAP